MRAMTVEGPVDAADLGVVLTHEHLLIDLRYRFVAPDDPAALPGALAPLTMDRLGLARRNIGAIRDNLVLDSEELAIAELAHFKAAGGGTLVDCSQDGIGRDVRALRRISRATGVHIVAPTGAYLQQSHPAWVAASSVEELTDRFVGELTVGIEATDIRAGIIGELGVGQLNMASPGYAGSADETTIHPYEVKVLQAGARAARITGAPVSVHIWPWGTSRLGLTSLDILEEEGADPSRVIVCHLDVNPHIDTIVEIARRGAIIEFDTFGYEPYLDPLGTQVSRDTDRITALLELMSRGLGDQIVIAQDVCTKIQTVAYGGWGYAHISRNIEPRLRSAGMTDAEIRRIRVDTPARLLAFVD